MELDEAGPAAGQLAVCRSIHPLHNYEPPASEGEIREAAIQYVRKVGGMREPSAANRDAFEAAVDEVAAATRVLLDGLVVAGPPRNRDLERLKARARWEKRASRSEASKSR